MDPILLEDRLCRREGLVTRRIAGEMLLVPVASGVADMEAIYTLNEVGAAVWEMLDRTRELREISAVVCEAYEVDLAQAERDVLALASSLFEEGLVTRTEKMSGTPSA